MQPHDTTDRSILYPPQFTSRPAAPVAPSLPPWRRELDCLARLARRRVQIRRAYDAIERPSLADEIALVAAHLADLEAVAALRAARLPADVRAVTDGSLVEVGR